MACAREFRAEKLAGVAAEAGTVAPIGGRGVKLSIGGSARPLSSNAWSALTASALNMPLVWARGAPAMKTALDAAAAISCGRRVIVSAGNARLGATLPRTEYRRTF